MTNTAEITSSHALATTNRARSFRGALAPVLGCVLAGALLTAGSAMAASRAFKVHNHSSHALQLEGARPVPTFVCSDPSRCVPTHYSMAFEGRPADGAVLQPAKVDGGVVMVRTHVWELKYGFSPLGGVQYAANVWYRIVGTGGTVEYTIETWSTSNESACKVIPAQAGRCTAEGLRLSFRNH